MNSNMGFLDIFRRQQRSESASASSSIITYPVSIDAGSDVVTRKELAMKIAAVYRCVDVVSKGVAQLPMVVKRKVDDYFVIDNDDVFGLTYILQMRPNERLSAYDFKRSIMTQLLIGNGNAYVKPEWGAEGYNRMILLSPGSCVYDVYSNTYVVSDPINQIHGTFDADEIIHLKNLSLDGGYTGVSTLQYASRTLAISANADSANVESFKTRGTLSGFVSGKNNTLGFGALQDTQLQGVADNIEKQLASGKKIFNLPGEMTFNQISLSPSDIQLLETKTFNVLDICRFFGVHPDKVFAQQSANYKASEMSQVSFLTDTLQPILTQIENELQIKLIPRELAMQYKIDFDIEPLLQTDLLTQADYINKTISSGVKTVNQWRKKFGQAPVEGGDKVLVSANLKALDALNAEIPTKTE
jgi:HK97 family phage portal protein